jgi:acetyl esterase
MDPQVATYLEQMAALNLPTIAEQGVEAARAMTDERAGAMFGPSEDVHAVEDIEVDGVHVRLYAPAADPGLPVVVYLHGGGWVIGSLESHDALCRALTNRTGVRVAAVDYRMAPEHRFPAAVDDCWAVTRWAFGQSGSVAVAGDSAGGNLAAVMAIRARDAGLRLAQQVLTYPVTDHRFDTTSYVANGEGYGLTVDSMRWYWDQYLGGADGSHPDASPLRAASLAGVAPALVQVCALDVLRDEGVAYAERLRAAGVPTVLTEYDGMVHGFIRMPAVLDRARDGIGEVAAALRKALLPD